MGSSFIKFNYGFQVIHPKNVADCDDRGKPVFKDNSSYIGVVYLEPSKRGGLSANNAFRYRHIFSDEIVYDEEINTIEEALKYFITVMSSWHSHPPYNIHVFKNSEEGKAELEQYLNEIEIIRGLEE